MRSWAQSKCMESMLRKYEHRCESGRRVLSLRPWHRLHRVRCGPPEEGPGSGRHPDHRDCRHVAGHDVLQVLRHGRLSVPTAAAVSCCQSSTRSQRLRSTLTAYEVVVRACAGTPGPLVPKPQHAYLQRHAHPLHKPALARMAAPTVASEHSHSALRTAPWSSGDHGHPDSSLPVASLACCLFHCRPKCGRADASCA